MHELLAFFERAGWDGAPRFLGFDGQGREILSFVDGRSGIVDVIMWWQDRCWRGTPHDSMSTFKPDLTFR